MAKVLPIRLLSRLPLPCWSRPHLARTSSRPASRPSLLVRTFATTSSLARPAEDAAPTKAHITARGVTQSRPPEQRAEVRVEGVTLVRAGEATSARRAADVGDVDAARHDPTDDATGSAADRTDSYSRRRRVDGTLSASPVALSEEQDPTLGHLTSTSTHLLRLTLPLPSPDQPVSFVLHPAQPLSYLSRLIAAELPSSLPDVEVVHYRGFGEDGRWSEATDLADFLRQSANIKAFEIDLLPAARRSSNDSNIEHPKPLKSIKVLVPSFLSRTRYLRDRLDQVNDHLREMADLKAECDRLAKQGARRVALGGLGGLVAYWGAVAAATWQWGWDIMEPVTYLIGHGVIVAGYLYWLLHRRAPDYDVIFTRTISSRQAKLYMEKGFDYERHQSLIAAGRKLRGMINKLAGEYGVEWEDGTPNDTVTERAASRLSEGKREVQSSIDESVKLERQSNTKPSFQDDEGKEDDEDDDDDRGRVRKGKDLVKKELKKLAQEKD